MQIIQDKTFDQERALYGSRELTVTSCRFDGPADGESAFKECRDIRVCDCYFNLRYPFWHGTVKMSPLKTVPSSAPSPFATARV